MKRTSLLLATAALVLGLAVPAVLAAEGTRIVLRPAKAFPAAKGSAKFRARPGERELQIEVEHIRRLAGRRVVFFVGGRRLGTARVNAFGAARIERNTERGQRVPAVRAGTRVRVRTLAGVLIVFGSF
jgi:hypothetical protein